MSPAVQALLAAVLLAGVHLAAGRLVHLRGTPRHWALSAGAGVSVAYVFVHLLPEVATLQQHLADADFTLLDEIGREAWLVVTVGLLAFHGLEIAARRSRRRGGGDEVDDRVAWLHVSSFAAYNVAVGHLLTQRAHEGGAGLVLFTLAMGVHFVVNDHGLREQGERVYDRVGQWLVAAAVVGGWALGSATELGEIGIGLLVAFVGGSTIMHVLKEELPEDRESRLTPLVAGAAAYGALLLVA